MKLHNKFKRFSASTRFLRLPLRILKFKRTKWAPLQRFIEKPRRKSRPFYNLCFSRCSLGTWTKMRASYKQYIVNKRHIKILSHFFVGKKFFRDFNSLTTKQNLALKVLGVNLFRLDLFLFNSRIAVSCSEARNLINNSFVLVNGMRVKSNTFLKKGDVISFCTKKQFSFCLKQNIKRFLSLDVFFFFIEVDLYSNSFIFLHDRESLHLEHLSLLDAEDLDFEIFRFF